MKRLLGLVALTLVLLVVDFKVIGFLLAVIIVVAGLAFFGDKRDLFNKVFNFDKKLECIWYWFAIHWLCGIVICGHLVCPQVHD